MRTDITLTLPCPLCPPPGRMLTAIYEPAEMSPGDLPLIAEVTGCAHADLWNTGDAQYVLSSAETYQLGDTLYHAIDDYMRDRYTDQLENSAKYRRLREEC